MYGFDYTSAGSRWSPGRNTIVFCLKNELAERRNDSYMHSYCNFATLLIITQNCTSFNTVVTFWFS